MSLPTPPRRLQTSPSPAFSLIELLVVMAILGILASVVLPGLSGMMTSRGVTQAANEVSSMLELARSEAISRQTYVWAGIQQVTNDGALGIRLGVVSSMDGTTNTASNNLQPLTRALLVQRVQLTNYSGLKSAALWTTAPTRDLSTNVAGISQFAIGSTTFNNRTITFTPGGEAMLMASPADTNGFDPYIAVGLIPSVGRTNDDALVILDGSTALPRIIRQ